jgi:putative endonuclease
MTVQRIALGRAGEDRVAAWYEGRGYEVLDRNWRCRDGELDVVAGKGRTLVVCEVKTRSSLAYGHPAEAVTWQKQRRIRGLAARWIAERGVRPKEVRFDVACVLPTSVEVIEAAF